MLIVFLKSVLFLNRVLVLLFWGLHVIYCSFFLPSAFNLYLRVGLQSIGVGLGLQSSGSATDWGRIGIAIELDCYRLGSEWDCNRVELQSTGVELGSQSSG